MWRVICGCMSLDKFLESWEHFTSILRTNSSEKNSHEFLKGCVSFCLGAAYFCGIIKADKSWVNMWNGKCE